MSAIRLTIAVQDGKPDLKSVERITMRARRQRHTEAIAREVGTWLETRDRKGTVLYASILDSMVFSPMIEVRTGVGDPGLTAVKSRVAQMLHVVVPDFPGTATVHILRRDKRDAKPSEILKADL